MRPEVYLVRNLLNGHSYVGVTTQGVLRRWTQHCYTARRKPVTYLHRAIAKYGPESFEVEKIGVAVGLEDGSLFEQMLIKQHKPEYNQTNGGELTVGRRVSEEVRQKMSASAKGRKNNPKQSAEHAIKIKQKLAEDPEYRSKVLVGLVNARGRIDREKQKEAAREFCRTRTYSEEERRICGERLRTLGHTKEAREKVAAKKRKKVVCIDTGVIYESVLDAAEKTGVFFSSISRVCRGERQRAGNLVFHFA